MHLVDQRRTKLSVTTFASAAEDSSALAGVGASDRVAARARFAPSHDRNLALSRVLGTRPRLATSLFRRKEQDMYWYQWSWFGMSLFWWLFWVALIVMAFGFAVPVPRSRMRLYEDPLATLARRYAAGELTTEEYDERRTRLEQASRTNVTSAHSAA